MHPTTESFAVESIGGLYADAPGGYIWFYVPEGKEDFSITSKEMGRQRFMTPPGMGFPVLRCQG